MRPLLVALALGAATCGGGAGGGPVAVDDFESELLDAVCTFAVTCEEMPDRATCLAAKPFLNFDAFATLEVDVAAGTVTYDGQAARACIDVFKRFTSCKATQIGDAQVALAVCRRAFLGMVPPGGACFFNEECADRGTCSSTTCTTPECCAGTCLARPAPIPVGSYCSNSVYEECVEGSVCSNASNACEVPLAPGARCTASDTCVVPYECRNIDPATLVGTCTPPPETGQPCGMVGLSGSCNDERDSCDDVAHVCKRRIPAGGACTFRCVYYAECDGTTCVQRPGLGASCDPLLPADECLGSLDCDPTTAVCTAPAGGACR
jgi:hypothetical protein